MAERQRVENFTQLEAWQRARELHAMICLLCKGEGLRRQFRFVEQIKGSANSVMANLAEGFEKGSRPELHRFTCIAKGSVGETLSHLYAALDDGTITREQFEEASQLAGIVGRLVGGLRKALDTRRGPRR